MGLGGVAIAVPPYVIHPKNGRSRTGWGAKLDAWYSTIYYCFCCLLYIPTVW